MHFVNDTVKKHLKFILTLPMLIQYLLHYMNYNAKMGGGRKYINIIYYFQ